jgi:hypothetical protein
VPHQNHLNLRLELKPHLDEANAIKSQGEAPNKILISRPRPENKIEKRIPLAPVTLDTMATIRLCEDNTMRWQGGTQLAIQKATAAARKIVQLMLSRMMVKPVPGTIITLSRDVSTTR